MRSDAVMSSVISRIAWRWSADRKSTRLNSSHLVISYAVFCLKKKTIELRAILQMTLRFPVSVLRLEHAAVCLRAADAIFEHALRDPAPDVRTPARLAEAPPLA